MYSHCETSGTPLSVSEDDFLALASSVSSATKISSTTTASSSTSTQGTTTRTGTSMSTPTPTPDDSDDQHGGLSTGATVGIIAGAAIAGVFLLLAAIFLFIRHRKRHRQYQEVHPLQSSNISQTYLDNAGHPSTLPGHASMARSELEGTEPVMGSPSFGNTWQSSWTGSQIPHSPNELEAVKKSSQRANWHQAQPAEIYEMSAESETPAAVSPTSIPVEMPTIFVVSPTLSPASRSTDVGWDAESLAEHDRYEPYRTR